MILLLMSVLSFSQNNVTITGKVTDEANKPLEGVTVQVQGTKNITLTKRDGTFSIMAPSTSSVLVLSSVGFRQQEITLTGQSEVHVSMATLATTLNDVVVVGYGTQRKSDVTGSLSRITAEQIQERPTQNVLQALQGKAAGVQVSSNFKPGELPVVRVRGNRSLGASNDPFMLWMEFLS